MNDFKSDAPMEKIKYEQLGQGMATLIDKGYELEVVIPSDKHVFGTLYAFIWLVGWIFGEVFSFSSIITSPPEEPLALAFLIVWLIGWTFVGVMIVSKIIWNLFGKEIILLSAESLKIERRALKVSRSKIYALPDVKNFRLFRYSGRKSSFFGWSGQEFWNKNGKLAFDYGMKTVKFAFEPDEAEASYILEFLKPRIPE